MKAKCRECHRDIPEEFVDEYDMVIVGFCQNEWCRDYCKQQIQSHPNSRDNLKGWIKGV